MLLNLKKFYLVLCNFLSLSIAVTINTLSMFRWPGASTVIALINEFSGNKNKSVLDILPGVSLLPTAKPSTLQMDLHSVEGSVKAYFIE